MKIKNWFILAGGSATRWQGYQGEKNKCFVKIDGERLIDRTERLLKENGYLVSLDLSDLDIEKIFNDIPKCQAEPEDIDPNWQKLLKGEL